MIKKVKATSPLNANDIKFFDVTCSDSENYANGVPKPVEVRWQNVFEKIELIDMYEILP